MHLKLFYGSKLVDHTCSRISLSIFQCYSSCSHSNCHAFFTLVYNRFERRLFTIMTDKKYEKMIGVIDQGTSSSRFVVFSAVTGEVIAKHQIEISREHPQSGWVQQSAADIYQSTLDCMNSVAKILRSLKASIKVCKIAQPVIINYENVMHMYPCFCRTLLLLVLRTNVKHPLLGTVVPVNPFVLPSYGQILELPVL